MNMFVTPTTNTYRIEKAGVKKIIHQSPLYENGVFSGLIEISLELPQSLPHFIRDQDPEGENGRGREWAKGRKLVR